VVYNLLDLGSILDLIEVGQVDIESLFSITRNCFVLSRITLCKALVHQFSNVVFVDKIRGEIGNASEVVAETAHAEFEGILESHGDVSEVFEIEIKLDLVVIVLVVIVLVAGFCLPSLGVVVVVPQVASIITLGHTEAQLLPAA
jgi:hypothetical protein